MLLCVDIDNFNKAPYQNHEMSLVQFYGGRAT